MGHHTSFADDKLINGTKYYYWVSASIPNQIDQNSNEASATPAALPELVSAASRKAHGTVDYDISITKPLTKGPPVECRSGSTLKLVATFNKPVSGGEAKVVVGQARLNGKPTFAGNTMTINLNDVSVRQKLQIDLTNVKATDGTPETPPLAKATLPALWILTGDVNGDLEVNAADTAEWQRASGTFAGSPGFDPRADITGNGAVDLADAIRIRENYGKKVP